MVDYKPPLKSASQPAFSFGTHAEMGKTEARNDFLQLVNYLQTDQIHLTVTDRGEKVAVMMSYKTYSTLMTLLEIHTRPAPDLKPLVGLIAEVGDLEDDKKKIAALFEESSKRFADEY